MLADLARGWRGIVAVVATYVHFLIFAQYGFLRLLAARLGEGSGLAASMTAMGLAGLAVSLASGAVLGRVATRRALEVGLVGCAASALLALAARDVAGFAAAAGLTGAATGWLTVALAADLRRLLPVRRYGLAVGAGTGLAYFVCNVPALFEGDPRVQALTAAAGCLLALAVLPRTRTPAGRADDDLPLEPQALAGTGRFGLVGVVLMFLALIWIDSAAFATIQQSAALKGQTWDGAIDKLLLGTLHLLAALAAGHAIDRARLFVLPPLALGAFAVAFGLLGPDRPAAWLAGPLYVAGISAYSTALVAFPSRLADGPGRVPARWRAAWLFGIAGWVGSALGVGMAREIGRVAGPFLAIAAALLVAGWAMLDRGRARRLVTVYGPALLVAAVALPTLWTRDAGPAGATSAVERGRRVYIDEGCINCHSQYVRPDTRDVELWGPYVPARLDEEPPLIGNRRQGPDLTNVGNRRSARWQRLHLIDPRSVSPGSKMPSYEHLFHDGRGDDLVAYLSSLGRETADDHWRETLHYRERGVVASMPAHGAALFARYCTPCHGTGSRGDGPAAPSLQANALDLLKPRFQLVPTDLDGEPDPEALARAIKFGIPGTSMPGHEVFSDEEIADLVGYLQTLRHQRTLTLARVTR